MSAYQSATKKAVIESSVKLSGATIELVTETVAAALCPDEPDCLSLTDSSGHSGAKTYICKKNDKVVFIVKVSTDGGVLDSHPATIARVKAASDVLREHGIAPPILMKGGDFHVEASGGEPCMADYFHFKQDLAPMSELAKLMAKIHSLPTAWFEPLRKEHLARDPELGAILCKAPPYAQCWNYPWSGLDTGMVVLGVGAMNGAAIASQVVKMLVDTGVYEKAMLCEAFQPMTEAGRREVIVHGDFKPDNILRAAGADMPTAIDYDITAVGPAVHEFGLPYMMWLGSRFTTYDVRFAFVRDYLAASGFGTSDEEVRAFMLDCEVNTIVAFPGLLAHIYDHEIPLLRGTEHPTARTAKGELDVRASGPDASPTGPEIVDLLAEAVTKIRADEALVERSLQDGLVVTLHRTDGLGSAPLSLWLKGMQKDRMLRLFGIAETDGGEIYVASHAAKKGSAE